MTKVIKGEFEKHEDVKDEDVSLTYDASLEAFYNEFNRLSRMDNDLFTYEVDMADIPCGSNMDDDLEEQVSHEADDDMGFDPSDVAFTEWLRSKFFNYKMMDHYTRKALWIYWIRGDDEVELTDEESSDDEDEVAENVPWVYDKPWLDQGIWEEPKPVKHTCKPFNYKTGCLEWPTCSWRDDGFYSKVKEEALRNKAIMEGLIREDDDVEREELFEVHELPVCNIRRFMMIKYSFGQDEEYVAVKEDEYNDLTRTSEDAYRAYQEIFRMMDEGWMVARAK
ncbi:hypothetical protein Tco_0569821 [Tanacetum coccineum]